MRHSLRLLTITVCLGTATLTACIKQEENRGYAIEFAKLDQVKPGKSTKDDVFAALGSPSTTSAFGQEKWYYINMKMKRSALTTPEMVGEDTIIVTFNKNGVVDKVDRATGENSRDIAFAKDKTRTEGNSVSVMEQFLGNLGRFNPTDKGPAAGKVHTPQPGM